MANLQSQIDILAKAVVNEHVRVTDIETGINKDISTINENMGGIEFKVNNSVNSIDVDGPDTFDLKTIDEISKTNYFIDANGKISQITEQHSNTEAINETVAVINHMSGGSSTHINKVKNISGDNKEIYAVNFIGTTQNCHNNNVRIQVIS